MFIRFRETYGGLHLKYKIDPDIAVFGKSIANGIPLTVVIGSKNIMDKASKSFISSTFGPILWLQYYFWLH